jgi:acylphosphatase
MEVRMSDIPPGHRLVIVHIEGCVQGVHYRASAREKARALGIDAEPVNLDDGSVRITASGPSDAVDRFLTWCREGPPLARVTGVRVEEVP